MCYFRSEMKRKTRVTDVTSWRESLCATMTGLGPSTSSSGIFPPFSVYSLHTPRLFTHFPVGWLLLCFKASSSSSQPLVCAPPKCPRVVIHKTETPIKKSRGRWVSSRFSYLFRLKLKRKVQKKKETSEGKCLISITRRGKNLIRRKTHAFSIDFVQKQQPLRPLSFHLLLEQ